MSQQINLINPLLLKKRHAFGLREMTLGLVWCWRPRLHGSGI